MLHLHVRPILTCLLLTACARIPAGSRGASGALPPVAPAATLARGFAQQAGAGTILLMGLEMPSSGTVIGGHFGGTHFDVRQTNYQISDAARAFWTATARSRGESLLRNAGYSVRAMGPASGDAQQLLGVQYGLSGRVTEIAVRSTGTSEPYRVDAQADVSWELLDLGSGAAVFGRNLHGAIRLNGTLDDAVAQVLDQTLARLLVDSLFLRAFNATRADPDAGGAVRFTRELPADRQMIVLETAEMNASADTSTIARIAYGVVSLRNADRMFGTAFLLTRDGLGIAFGHGVHGARALRARMASGLERPVRILRYSRTLDVALIQVACPGDCPTVDWVAPTGVTVFTSFMAVAAPRSDVDSSPVTFGRVGGRWGLANGITLQGAEGLVAGGEPIARVSSGRVFALASVRGGRTFALMLSEVLDALKVQPPPERMD